jgi:hypothetical protein
VIRNLKKHFGDNRDLFRHTAGYTYGTGMPEAFGTHYQKEQMLYTNRGMFPPMMIIAEAADRLARIPLLHQPGARFCQALVNLGELDGTRVLAESTLRKMYTNQLSPAFFDTFRFGLGFAIQDISLGRGDRERTAIAYRWGGDANTSFQVVPSEGMVQVFMRQLVPSNHRVVRKLFPIVYLGTE